jgi:hypothetical protein
VSKCNRPACVLDEKLGIPRYTVLFLFDFRKKTMTFKADQTAIFVNMTKTGNVSILQSKQEQLNKEKIGIIARQTCNQAMLLGICELSAKLAVKKKNHKNIRLEKMIGGRYYMQRIEEKGKGGGQSGLI